MYRPHFELDQWSSKSEAIPMPRGSGAHGRGTPSISVTNIATAAGNQFLGETQWLIDR